MWGWEGGGQRGEGAIGVGGCGREGKGQRGRGCLELEGELGAGSWAMLGGLGCRIMWWAIGFELGLGEVWFS